MDKLSKSVAQEAETVCLPGLRQKKVVITAGASGIGFSIARFLHAQGAQIAICDVDDNALENAKTI